MQDQEGAPEKGEEKYVMQHYSCNRGDLKKHVKGLALTNVKSGLQIFGLKAAPVGLSKTSIEILPGCRGCTVFL